MRPPDRVAIGLLALLTGAVLDVGQPRSSSAPRVLEGAPALRARAAQPNATPPPAPPSPPLAPDAPGMYVPYLAGPYTRVFVPSSTRYVNDHTLARGPDGVWHLYGITHTRRVAPQLERTLLHATAPALRGPWTEQPDVLTADASLHEQVLWAPHVFERAPGRWTMLTWGGYVGGEDPPRGMRRADSTDLRNFRRVERFGPDPRRRVPGGRDPFVMRLHDRWLVYSVGGVRIAGTDRARGQILVTSTADDLEHPAEIHWSTPTVVLEDPRPDFYWGNLESPFIVPYGGQYYLFVTRTGQGSQTDYARTNVFRSADPVRFTWQPIAELFAHAAEVVREDDRYFITSAGWTGYIGDDNRGVSIAPLQWARQ